MNKSLNSLALSIIALCLVFTSCRNDKTTQDANTLNLYLTDCPYEAEAVFVEIVNIIVEDDDDQTVELNTLSGIYNLLDFQDGVDTLIASGTIDFDNIDHIYFQLGDNNSIVVEGDTFPLQLQSDNLVKVKIKLDKFEEDADLLVDFFACTSIVSHNGEFYLKPVIKFKGNKNQGHRDDFIEDIIEDVEECFTLVYPINLYNQDSLIVEIADKEDLIDFLIEGEPLGIAYPIFVLNQNEEQIELQNEEQVEELIESCEEDDDEDEDDEDEEYELQEIFLALNDCFEIVFPIFVSYDSLDIQEATDLDDLLTLIDIDESAVIVFPVELIKSNGNSKTVNHIHQLADLADCDEEVGEEEDEELEEMIEILEEIAECYQILYPIEVVLNTGEIVDVFDVEEIEELLDEDVLIEIVFPIEFVDAQGNVFQVEDIDAAEEFTDCEEEEDDEDDEEDENEEIEELFDDLLECFDLILPLTLVSGNESIEVNSVEELFDVLDEIEIDEIIFPVTILDEDDNVIEIGSYDELEDIIEDCE